MTRTLWRNTVLAVIFSFIAGFSGIVIGLKVLPATSSGTIGLHAKVHHEFVLDDEQKSALHQLEEQYARGRKKYARALKAANAELAAAIKEHHDLSPEVVLAEQKYLSVLGDFQTDTLRHIFAMRAILLPEQAKKFDDIVLRSLHDLS